MTKEEPTAPQPLAKPVLLVGEGKEEVRFFSALLKHLGRTDVQIEQCQGKDGLRPHLKAQALRTGFENVGTILIVQDADENPKGRFDSVCHSVTACGFNPPAAHGALSDGRPAIGVFIMPDGAGMGMLEDLCLAAVSDDTAMRCVDDFIQCVQDCGNDPKPQAKARIQTWLASRQSPGKRLGEAAEAGFWPWNHDAFQDLIRFLTTP